MKSASETEVQRLNGAGPAELYKASTAEQKSLSTAIVHTYGTS